MIREVRINDSIVAGYDKELIEKILPHLSDRFKQRKQFFEYYFDPIDVELDLEDIENLSKEYVIELNWEQLIIKI
jgi:predicted solute-binding protein